MTSILFFTIMLAVGIISIWLGINILQGHRRYDYIYPHYYSGAINYASIPLGTMSLILAFIAALKVTDTLGLFVTSIAILIGLVGLALNFIQPKFMRPQWYRWLEENHEDIMHFLHRDAREMGYQKWKEQTQTQEGLEAWVEEVRRKHRL